MLVNDQAIKQSDLFGEISSSLAGETNEINLSYKNPSVAQTIPRLEEVNSLNLNDRVISQPLLNSVANAQNSDQVVSYIKNLERFCNDVADNKLFWTPEVIAFFNITDEILKREYEFAREEIQRQL